MIDPFDAIAEDETFRENLYQRKKPQEHPLEFRHGISPVAFNVRNTRYKKQPKFDKTQVSKTEGILNSLIQYGFSDHVDEQLLKFDKKGILVDVSRKSDRASTKDPFNINSEHNLNDPDESDEGEMLSHSDFMGGTIAQSVHQSVLKSEVTSEFNSIMDDSQSVISQRFSPLQQQELQKCVQERDTAKKNYQSHLVEYRRDIKRLERQGNFDKVLELKRNMREFKTFIDAKN